MAESAALLVDGVLSHQPIRQWVLSFPSQLRFLLASYRELMGKVPGIIQRVLSTHMIRKADFTRAAAPTGAVTLIQRFGSALNLNLHFHTDFLDGIYVEDGHGKLWFQRVKAPNIEELKALVHAISHRVARFMLTNSEPASAKPKIRNSFLKLNSNGFQTRAIKQIRRT